MEGKIFWHVRSACGVTIDWLHAGAYDAAKKLAREENLQVYKVDHTAGTSTRVI